MLNINILYVALGGAVGSAARYLFGTWIQSISKASDFPFGTLAVNLIGCFIIGFLSHLAETHDVFTPEARAFIFVGILGGFTTFSSFGNETLNLMRQSLMTSALINIGSNVILGLFAVWLGRIVGDVFWK